MRTLAIIGGLLAAAGLALTAAAPAGEAQRAVELWYYAGGQRGTKYATSRDGRNWTKHGVVLAPGGRGSWDEGEVSSPYVLLDRGRYRMYYTGSSCPMEQSRRPRKDCTPHIKIGLATAPLTIG